MPFRQGATDQGRVGAVPQATHERMQAFENSITLVPVIIRSSLGPIVPAVP
jgi:hypothetical protein